MSREPRIETVLPPTREDTAAAQASPQAGGARPFIKWAGGKVGLVAEIVRVLPPVFGRYFEPFAGGAALFWTLRPSRGAVLADANRDLVACYWSVRNEVDAVVEELRTLRCDRAVYEDVRRRFNTERTMASAVRAAWFIYLNRCGFNGLFRVNRRGEFNVSFGRYTNPTILNEPLLRACSAALAGAKVVCQDFAVTCAQAVAGDLVYFDPPYVPASKTANFTGYTPGGFGPAERARYHATCDELVERGVHVVASNSNTVEALAFHRGARIVALSRSGGMNSNPKRRGRVAEILAVRLAEAR